MLRLHLIELEDQSWWPKVFRDYATDYLTAVIRLSKLYAGLAPTLADHLRVAEAETIVDLCSGGGGPWPHLLPLLRDQGFTGSVYLTDKFPNLESLRELESRLDGISCVTQSVDAAEVPSHFRGFRTIFTAFHHFSPQDAKRILASAVSAKEGILIAEPGPRSWRSLFIQAFIPVGVLLITPLIRPFRFGRFFWTYLVPIMPFAIWFDGVVSCLRVYNPDELRSLALSISGDDYDWRAGEVSSPGAPVSAPFLIGMPKR